MKRFMASAATALVLSTSAYAAQHSVAFTDYNFEATSDIYASELIGARIYATEAEVEGEVADGAEKEWEDLGEVNDVILSRDGQVQAVILGVGGFLGIGERDVAVSMDQIKIVKEEGDSDDWFLVVNANRAMVEEAPEYVRSDKMTEEKAEGEAKMPANNAAAPVVTEPKSDADPDMETETEMEKDAEAAAAEVEKDAKNIAAEAEAETKEATAEASAEMNKAEAEMKDERPMLTAPDVEREGYSAATPDDLTADDLEGENVYGADDKSVGEIDELILTDDGKIERVVINVGGFLGIGEKPVAVTFDELTILRNEGGDDVRIYIDATKESLEAQPKYEN
ncbi:photosystem reaction center subunit H [Brevirhabdus pacifica]|uniref:Photosystem reaction center subunit H n=1 Tax=Brevirhabdus pacifica TaxID=1267768 RepID=A0A1U7DJN8_9RHOB|nr:PRC-barrel domain-containing protein [Brevirhabdus pacifica]APX90210.1 photosystem reaction center subunit H [Brevirhabdus pacifica]OWU78737.1 photosystem reaction center subunit H [Loktanella sp. 22II-4b]PJJ80642.1 PRC-barrel domain protein [Brevirhabdus pacifica]